MVEPKYKVGSNVSILPADWNGYSRIPNGRIVLSMKDPKNTSEWVHTITLDKPWHGDTTLRLHEWSIVAYPTEEEYVLAIADLAATLTETT